MRLPAQQKIHCCVLDMVYKYTINLSRQAGLAQTSSRREEIKGRKPQNTLHPHIHDLLETINPPNHFISAAVQVSWCQTVCSSDELSEYLVCVVWCALACLLQRWRPASLLFRSFCHGNFSPTMPAAAAEHHLWCSVWPLKKKKGAAH